MGPDVDGFTGGVQAQGMRRVRRWSDAAPLAHGTCAAILPQEVRNVEGIQEASKEGCASTAHLAAPRWDEAVAKRT
jgi:hypothetical protein